MRRAQGWVSLGFGSVLGLVACRETPAPKTELEQPVAAPTTAPVAAKVPLTTATPADAEFAAESPGPRDLARLIDPGEESAPSPPGGIEALAPRKLESGVEVHVRFARASCQEEADAFEPKDARFTVSFSSGSPEGRTTTFALGPVSVPAPCSEYVRTLDVGDFNFDGHEDVAVPFDVSGPYSSPTYVVFLFSPSAGTFESSPALSALTQEYLGMFAVHPGTKRLIASSKSGCCIHWTSEYEVHENLPVRRSTDTITHADVCTVETNTVDAGGKTTTTERPCTTEEKGE